MRKLVAVLCLGAVALASAEGSMLIGNNPDVSDGGLVNTPGVWTKAGDAAMPDARAQTDRGGPDGGDWAIGGSDGSGSSAAYDGYYSQTFALGDLDPAPGNAYDVTLSGYAKAWAQWWSGEDWQWKQESHIELWADGAQVADMMSSNNTNRDTWELWEWSDTVVVNTDLEVRLRSVKGNDNDGAGGLGAIYWDSRYDDVSLEVNPVPEPATLGLLGLGLLGFLRRRR